MKTNVLSKIPVGGADRSRARFNLAHDINTTCGFGEIQPILGRLTPADTKTTIDFKSLIRLAPMIAPTFGRMHFKTWTQFIPCSDVSKNFDAMMSQTNVTRPAGTFVPKAMAHLPLSILSSFCFVGADVTVYFDELALNSGTGIHAPYIPTSRQAMMDYFGVSDAKQVPPILGFTWQNSSTDRYASYYNGYTAWYLNLGKLVSNHYVADFYVPTALSKPLSESTAIEQLIESPFCVAAGFKGPVHVSLESADYVYSFVYNNKVVHLAFKFSSFGKRFAKQIKGLGYQVDLTAHEVDVSLLPLFAEFLSYYEIFAPQLYENWENTSTAKLITFCDNSFGGNALNVGDPDCSNLFTRSDWQHYLRDWILEMSTMYVTESQDWVSSHTEEMLISPSSAGALRFYDFDGALIDNIQVPSSNDSQTLPSYIKDVNHGVWDEEFLKRALRWTNINTIAGKKVADLLRAQGLGDYVDSHKSHFIGYTEQLINISDVVSTSDTFKPATETESASGSLLGEYGGRGLSFSESQNFVYENNQIGFVITLCAIVPECGYSQGVDHSLKAIDKFSFYNREFDALGMDLTPKYEICSARDWSTDQTAESNETHSSFGFTPRMSGFKVANNVVNGDFSLRSTRSVYLPYTLDKYIALGEKLVANANGSDRVRYNVYDLLSKIPVAGVVWRYPSRYPWLANLQRIFANMQTDSKEWQLYSDFFGEQAQAKWLYCSTDVDNFLVHIVCNLQQFAPMLPIERTFGTTDDNNPGNSEMEKA